MVDLRSDTVTLPTPAMRWAMSEAALGDDGYGEDPTVAELEQRFADRLGKEEAVFMPSGTMANQVALRCHTRPGDVVLAGGLQHIVRYELGAAAANAAVQVHCLDDADGRIDPDDVRIQRDGLSHHLPRPTALFLENTHMASGGRPSTPAELAALLDAAQGLRIHLDGARLFNAEQATGLSAAELASVAETVMCCLSKGLGCPVGSVLAGSAVQMEEARLHRKRLGGAMRQAGVIAAAGLVALDEMVGRLAEDHRRAARLVEAVGERWPDQAGRLVGQVTNIVVFDHEDPALLLAHLNDRGILGDTLAPGVVRLVTHHGIDDAGIERSVEAIEDAP